MHTGRLYVKAGKCKMGEEFIIVISVMLFGYILS